MGPSSLPEAIFKHAAPPVHPREVIKTPDEVDDLPIDEEVESTEHDIYEEIDTQKPEQDITAVSPMIEVKGELQIREEVIAEKHEKETIKEKQQEADLTKESEEAEDEISREEKLSKSIDEFEAKYAEFKTTA